MKTKRLICLLCALSFCLMGCHSELSVENENLPEYTKTLVEAGQKSYPLYLDDITAYRLMPSSDSDNWDYKVSDTAIVSVTYCTHNTPTAVINEHSHPMLEFASGVDLPVDVSTYLEKICVEPVKTVVPMTFADGKVWEVEQWSYVLDYTQVQPLIGVTVVLPVQRYVVHLSDQQRLCFTFRYQDVLPSYTASDLITLYTDGDLLENLDDLGKTLCDANDLTTGQAVLFFQTLYFNTDIKNASL